MDANAMRHLGSLVFSLGFLCQRKSIGMRIQNCNDVINPDVQWMMFEIPKEIKSKISLAL